MAKQFSRATALWLIGGIVIIAVTALLFVIPGASDNKVAHVPVAQSGRYSYGVSNLRGASPEQIGQYALEYVQHHLTVHGTPQVLLARAIKPGDMPGLGLGCPISISSIEEPPLTLVILKGSFDLRGTMLGRNSAGIEYNYVAYVFDQWSAGHMLFQASQTGSRFRTALNDPSLPLDESSASMVCPTEVPGKKTLHYGDVAPTVLPPELPEASPMPTSPPLPSPIPTEGIR